jgi:hypothetical protein
MKLTPIKMLIDENMIKTRLCAEISQCSKNQSDYHSENSFINSFEKSYRKSKGYTQKNGCVSNKVLLTTTILIRKIIFTNFEYNENEEKNKNSFT